MTEAFPFEDRFFFPKELKLDYRKQSGFNLVELMIVIAIMATLAAIAIPSYSHYINKSRAISAVVLTEPVRTEVTEYGMLHNGDFNGLDNQSLNLSSSELVNGSKDVSDISIQGEGGGSANIVATLADNLGALTWHGQYQNGNIRWDCTYPAGDAIAHYAPQGCDAN